MLSRARLHFLGEILTEKKTKGASGPNPIGVRLNPDLHDLMKAVAAITGSDIGEAYTVASKDWLKRVAATNPVVKSLIDQKCAGNAELRALMHSKPSLLANRA